jgi:hypothetical protein
MSFYNILKILSLFSPSLPITNRQFYSSLENNQISYFKSKVFVVNNSSISEEMLIEELRKF